MTGRIEIDVPARLPEPGRDADSDGITWTIRISTTSGDAPFSRAFEIPVYPRPR